MAFSEAKKEIIKQVGEGVKHFELGRTKCLNTDWSCTGLGLSRYSPVEGECLAVADSLDKARHFVLGCKDLLVAVDHRLHLAHW